MEKLSHKEKVEKISLAVRIAKKRHPTGSSDVIMDVVYDLMDLSLDELVKLDTGSSST